ncbi:UDP-glucuronosyltransferase 2A1-like isoform X4 [Bufo gargarizans]|uniref:UDP-glucuronosyltransferase 2A1-like isoform X4 n=2 Tax=Bufo gargarizans TaxID=30331 RepID=UPI001CF5608D|nr:UDP-glucuronosyltransferase 2A1-like isoform X4 [Bufo gargarizans]
MLCTGVFLLLLPICCLNTVSAGKVLAWPTDASHFLNQRMILEELARKGHDVTVLVHSAFMIMGVENISSLKFENFSVPFTREKNEKFLDGFLAFWIYDLPKMSYWNIYEKTKKFMAELLKQEEQICNGVVKNESLLKQLKENKFDVLVSDPMVPCGELIAELLGVPFVYSIRFSMGNSMERLCGKLPAPFSYVPGSMVELTDNLSFAERLKNLNFYIFQDILFHILFSEQWDGYYSEALDGSHFINLNTILEKLAHKGHEVTVLVHSAYMITDTNKTSALRFEVFPVSFDKEKNEALLEEFLRIWIYELPNMSYWDFFTRMNKALADSEELERLVCDGIIKNKVLLNKLHEEKFDILVADPLAPCGELIAEIIGVPFVYSFRFSMGNVMERHCGHIPTPYSYVPGTMTQLTDKMSFVERLKNAVFYLSQDAIFYFVVLPSWNQYYSEVLGRPTTLCEIMGKAEIWLIRTYWDFEYPRPFLPNFEFVGGLHCKPPKPLPEDMEKIVQSSGEHGIIVFSLGSMVKNLTDERSNVIASALSQLPQKVIWRYSGKRPATLGENTILYDWIPQNDLLGHPKTKAFITHGGTNGIYEAIYHGVPMVGIPLFADQPDNIIHMKTKGMAVMLDINKMQSQELVDAVNTVISNPSYKENAVRISQIHHDQPLKPLDRAVFWIEFVMRHKGAKHLRPASHDLSWYQYHCLDVIGFLLICLFLILYIIIKIFSFCCRTCRPARRKQKKH